MKTLKSILAIFILAIICFSCGNNPKKQTIKIGAILPLSGDVAVYGKSMQNGMDLALEEYFKNNPNGMKIEVIYEDSKADPKLAVNSIQKLSSIDKCKLVLGGFSSSEVLSISPIAEKNKIVLISPTASSPSITNAGDFIFRTTPSDNFDGEIMAKFAYNELHLRNVALIFANNDYGQGISKVFVSKFTALGGKISIQKSFESGVNDFKTQLTAIKEAKPDGLYIIAASEIGIILKQKSELNLADIKTFTVGLAENPKVIEIAGEAANNVFYSYPSFQVNSDDKEIKDFVSNYKLKYKNEPDVLAAYGYDLMNITLKVLENNFESSEKIKNALYNLKNFNGVTGQTSFDLNGDVTKTAGIKVIKQGKFEWYMNKFN
jgi:branched-chain amino acid transport system substrate-binding protein